MQPPLCHEGPLHQAGAGGEWQRQRVSAELVVASEVDQGMEMIESDLRKQAWDFFQMQAGQRLTTFNFYIALSSLLSGGLVANFKEDIRIPYLGLLLGFLLVLFSFIFWKLDNRNRELIKGAEETLKFFESQVPLADKDGRPHLAKRFTREEFDTNAKKATRSCCFWRNHYSYSDCFRLVFLVFTAVGILGATYSVFLAVGRP